MSDYNSSLPVRTENAGDVIAKIADATVTSQQLKVNADGSIDTNFSSASKVKVWDGTDELAINADGSLNATVSATNLDIRDLAFATDKVDVSGSSVTATATDLDIRDLAFATDKVDVSGSSVTATVSATNLDIRDLAFATDKVDVSGSSVTVSATDLDIRNLSNAQDSVTAHQGGSWTVAATQSGSWTATVSATDLDIRDLSHAQDSVKIGDGTDFLAINSDGSINVNITDASPGTAVCNYNTATVAANATSTHTYTSTGNFYLEQIEASGSGMMKIEVQVNGATKFVKFTSAAELNSSIKLSQPLLATTGQTVTIIRTNRDKASQDLYSTIMGYLA